MTRNVCITMIATYRYDADGLGTTHGRKSNAEPSAPGRSKKSNDAKQPPKRSRCVRRRNSGGLPPKPTNGDEKKPPNRRRNRGPRPLA